MIWSGLSRVDDLDYFSFIPVFHTSPCGHTPPAPPPRGAGSGVWFGSVVNRILGGAGGGPPVVLKTDCDRQIRSLSCSSLSSSLLLMLVVKCSREAS